MNNQNKQNLNRSELRKFGLMFALVLVILFGLLIPLLRHGSAMGLPLMDGLGPKWPWYAAGTVAIWALVLPQSLRLLHTPWMKFAGIAQWVNTRIIMLILFYVIILPIGLLLRLFGKDSMHRKFETTAQSYRVKADARDNTHMEKPY